MKTIFAVFLLLPVTTGLISFACSGTSDESVQHNLHCEAGERINIITGQYGFKYESDSCSRDCKYQSPQCDCNPGFVPEVESNLTNVCDGKKTCNFQPPKPDYEYCHYNTGKQYNNYTYSYIQYECVTGLTSYACSGSIDESVQHNLYCEAGERINIISGQYGFKYSSDSCNRDCKYQSPRCDCRLDFVSEVESNLMTLCDRKKTCNFQPPKPDYEYCYYNRRKHYNNYTYSYIQYECVTGPLRYSCSETSDQHHIYCEEGERLNIISSQYGFRYEWCSADCDYSDICDCHNDLNLKDSCSGACNFQLARLHDESCYFSKIKYAYDYKHTYIKFGCLKGTTTLPTRRTITTGDQGTYFVPGQVYTDTSTIISNKVGNSNPTSSTGKDRSGTTEVVLDTTEINKPKAVNHNQDKAVDTGVIVGIVVGCILLVILVFIAVVFIFKRKTIGSFIDNRFKDSARVSNPVYEAPSDGYNNVVFKNDNSPSVNVVKSDDYNHLHDIKNDNSMTTGNTYNHMGQTMGDYNHLPANNNSIHVDEHSDGAYNHLGMVNSKTHNSDYNHLNGLNVSDNVSQEVHNANYNHLSGVNGEIPKADYNHLDENKTNKISNDDYNHIGDLTNETTNDDYNHIGDAKHETIVEYELAHKGDLPVQDEQKPDNVQYEITDDERGDYSNISEHQSNYENFPISDHQTC